VSVLFIYSVFSTGCAALPLVVGAAGTVLNKETTGSKVDTETDQSTLEMRSVQLREIDSEYKITFRAAMDVLQDMGFTIAQTNMETGHVIGIKKIPVTTTTGSLLSSRQNKTYIPQESTVTMEGWGKGVTRVRVNTDLGKTEGGSVDLSTADKARYLEPDKFYEEFFANLSKAVFLRKEKI